LRAHLAGRPEVIKLRLTRTVASAASGAACALLLLTAGPAGAVDAADSSAATAATPAAAAEADLQAMLAGADVVPAAPAPGGTAAPGWQEVPGGTADAQLPSAQAQQASCADGASRFAAGAVTSYRCTTVRAEPAAALPAASLADAAASITWPAPCSPNNGTITPTYLAVSRRGACAHLRFGITITEYSTAFPQGRVVGTTDMHAVITMVASGATWASHMTLWLWSFTGVGSPTSTTGQVSGSGTSAAGAWGPSGAGFWHGDDTLSSTVPLGAVENLSGDWNLTVSGAGWGNPVAVDLPLATSRCDDTFRPRLAGCVFPGVTGLAGISQSAAPTYARHVYEAQMSGLPGRLSTGTVLTRLQNVTQKRANYNLSCPTSLVRPAGYSCDEYPFQSTYQGASTGGGTLARTLPWCQVPGVQRTGPSGWSRCMILVGDNSSGGGQLSGSYSSERLLDGDPFVVGYLP